MIEVTCAIIERKGQILAVQRSEEMSHPFQWEFPGGKLDPGENLEECIVREIMEELSITVTPYAKLAAVEYDYGNKQLRLHPYLCMMPEEDIHLTEHLDLYWADTQEMAGIDLAAADRIVLELYRAHIAPTEA